MKATLFFSTFWIVRSIAFAPTSMNKKRIIRKTGLSRFDESKQIQSKYERISLLLLAAKVGIFFGTSTGNTERVADLIFKEFGSDAEGPFDIDSVQGSVAKKFAEYDALIVGTPTWNTGADTERSGTGWDEIYYGEMQDLNVSGKTVAVFGLGDQISYSENYADASGELHDVFEKLGCKMIGYTSQEGYEHESSKAIRGDKFCGLLCDEINQDEFTVERVQKWVAQLKAEGILGSSSGDKVEDAKDNLVGEDTIPAVVNGQQDLISKLEEENSRLRKMLEDSKIMDRVLKEEIMDDSYTPYYNTKTGVTMWTSVDGKKCYFTNDAPKTP
mmetsp:Transcript_4957/g.9455  ORF Transcript_4957/g.9455 Transcript_4957/m.9455 type:complete len:329 (+) Transcript_4957:96-1082(+)|eukprot:CAMPEP_0176492980 /NCGR_PEP_ID=MMETSP0200_2-20121128/9308_1 /TAXON_ID=947934 /ORGANISM="Chaetoceros sp., Strain GSL56" /LENGTH=328 /DNA_ID=CAMNT_0017890619 /DNA_START=63 /DNA_END=1049 /DNA_ORIENTATION=+